jgi:hypothetical protein
MMRALAVLSAAAVALFALPTTAGAAADSKAPTSALPVSADGIVSFLAERSLFGMSMGAVLWLSIAAFAALLAFVALSRSRGQLASADSQARSDSVARPDFPRIDAASAAR